MTPTDETPLQMVRAEVNVRDFHRWMGTRRLQDPDHAVHCLLTECFGDLAPKPFRLMATRGASAACLYGYSTADAEALRDAAGTFAEPLQSCIIPADGINSKPMPSEWRTGKHLGFDIRIRPIVRRNDRAGERPGKECDAFLHEALSNPEKGGMKRTREQVYADWLSAQFDRKSGAILDQEKTRLVSFQRTRAYRKTNARHSEGPDAVMQGVLTVNDPAAFAAMLSQGIGRHRAYGYGMLLLRPARR